MKLTDNRDAGDETNRSTPAPLGPQLALELHALGDMIPLFEALSPAARDRVVRYLASRYGAKEPAR